MDWGNAIVRIVDKAPSGSGAVQPSSDGLGLLWVVAFSCSSHRSSLRRFPSLQLWVCVRSSTLAVM